MGDLGPSGHCRRSRSRRLQGAGEESEYPGLRTGGSERLRPSIPRREKARPLAVIRSLEIIREVGRFDLLERDLGRGLEIYLIGDARLASMFKVGRPLFR